MADSKRTILELHLHSHGDLQFGNRMLGGGSEEEPATPETATEEETGSGLMAGVAALVVLGLAFGVAFLRRRSERRERMEREQKNLDRWIPTR